MPVSTVITISWRAGLAIGIAFALVMLVDAIRKADRQWGRRFPEAAVRWRSLDRATRRALVRAIHKREPVEPELAAVFVETMSVEETGRALPDRLRQLGVVCAATIGLGAWLADGEPALGAGLIGFAATILAAVPVISFRVKYVRRERAQMLAFARQLVDTTA